MNLVSRRQFLETFGLTTAGLVVGVYADAAGRWIPTNEPGGAISAKPETSSPEIEAKSVGLNPNAFLHLAPTGLLTIVCHRSEMGQGIRSSLPVLLADELGADMKKVEIVQADGDKAYGDQNTDGSNSIRGIYTDMRKAAATARMMLIQAAAKEWKVDPATCEARDHEVIHKKSKKRMSFGDLAVEAGKITVPEPKDVSLRPDRELKRIGKALPLIDAKAYVTGKAPFGADPYFKDQLIAVIARPPVVGARINKYNKKAALTVPGVKQIIELPRPKAPWQFQPWGGVAVLAENTWAAMQGRAQLEATWTDGDENAGYDSTAFRAQLEKELGKPGTPLRKTGDVEKAIAGADRVIEANYYVPHLPHVAMEPPSCLVRFDQKTKLMEVWAPTQNPQAARTEAARALGVSEDNVNVHVTFLGGGFGRKSKADFVSEAVLLAKAAGVPVRVQWTREDDIHHDYYNTVNAQRLTAALDKAGKVVAWRHRTAFPPIPHLFDTSINKPGLGDLQQGVLDVALNIPNVQAEAFEAPTHVRVGWLRSVYNIFHAFAVNSFIDEIAHARKKDPRETMLEIYGPARTLSVEDLGIKELKNYGQPLDAHPVDGARLQNVIRTVTKMAGWKGSKKGQRAFGLAAHRSFLSYTAVVASVQKRPSGALWVDEVWIAIDAGKVINTDRVIAQMEGSVINGMNHFLYGGVTFKNGIPEQSNFDGVKLTRLGEEPRKIHVEIVKSEKAPGGIGEPGVPPVAPAIANAVFALTGQRIREFNYRGLHEA